MGKLKAAVEASHIKPGTACSVGRLIGSLDNDESVELVDILKGPDAAAAIARGLRSLGHEIKEGSISRHRRTECDCSR